MSRTKMKQVLLRSVLVIGVSGAANAEEMGYRLIELDASPTGCSQTTSITSPRGKGFVYVEHHSSEHRLFSDRSTTVEYYDPNGVKEQEC